MNNASDPQTEREWIIGLEGKIDRLSDAIELLAEKWENFEEKKMTDMLDRIGELEEWKAKWGGALITLSIIAAGTSFIATVITVIIALK